MIFDNTITCSVKEYLTSSYKCSIGHDGPTPVRRPHHLTFTSWFIQILTWINILNIHLNVLDLIYLLCPYIRYRYTQRTFCKVNILIFILTLNEVFSHSKQERHFACIWFIFLFVLLLTIMCLLYGIQKHSCPRLLFLLLTWKSRYLYSINVINK